MKGQFLTGLTFFISNINTVVSMEMFRLNSLRYLVIEYV
jgi:hypothetical protein